MSFLYPRTIVVSRPGAQSSSAVGFQGQAPSGDRRQDTHIATGVPANIQAKAGRGKDATGLPDGTAVAQWRVFTPKGALADGQVQDKDIITDDLNRRFKVVADYTNSMGANFLVERVEA